MIEKQRPFVWGRVAVILALASLANPAQALRFEIDWGEGISGSLNNAYTMGAHVRMQGVDVGLIGKSNLDPSLCPDQCLGTEDGPPTANQLEHIAAPGYFSINGDDGNQQFEKGDTVAGTGKLTSDFRVDYLDYGIVGRTVWFFDPINTGFDEYHPNRRFGSSQSDYAPAFVPRTPEVEAEVGTDFDLLEAYVFGFFEFGGREYSVKLGNQTLNWGESTLIALNSINTINPVNANRFLMPGLDLKEVFTPVGMLWVNTNLTPNLSMEVYYQYAWEPVITPAPGSFFGFSDIGVPGGTFASLPYAAHAEDPLQLERIEGPGGVVQSLNLTDSSLTILRDPDREPEDGGEWGVSFRYFAENIGGGTEFGFYAMNYHSRFPLASAMAAEESCARDSSQATAVSDCGGFNNGENALPIDSATIFLEYPEDIQLYGISFNTTIGDFAFQGEYSYRPNSPLQVDLEDLVTAALRPAFPRQDLTFGACPGCIVIPGADHGLPDFVMSKFRGQDVQAQQYVPGFERMKVGQFDIAMTMVMGADNPFRADQWIFLVEAGFTHVLDMPDKSQLQFEGPGTALHAGPSRLDDQDQLILNPKTQRDGYADDFAWGYRVISILDYKNVFMDVNFQPQLIFQHDVGGTAPGPGENFVEGRKTVQLTNNFIYEQFTASLGYTAFTGAGQFNILRDRDHATAVLKYEF